MNGKIDLVREAASISVSVPGVVELNSARKAATIAFASARALSGDPLSRTCTFDSDHVRHLSSSLTSTRWAAAAPYSRSANAFRVVRKHCAQHRLVERLRDLFEQARVVVEDHVEQRAGEIEHGADATVLDRTLVGDAEQRR